MSLEQPLPIASFHDSATGHNLVLGLYTQHMTRQREIQEAVAMASEPSSPFTDLPVNEWRDVFFGLTEDVKGHLIADMSQGELETFIDRSIQTR